MFHKTKLGWFVFLLALPLAGQQSINLASIAGRVADAAGAPIAGASVEAVRKDTGQKQEEQSDAQGQFHLGYLAPGDYTLTVAKPGFASFTRGLTLTVGAAFSLPIELAVAGQKTEITVEGEAPVLQAARTQVASAVSQREIRALPTASRDVLGLALLSPGVTPSQTNSTQTFAETSAVPGQGISIGSQRNFANSFIVDGLSSNDDAAGLNGNFFDKDVVDQFQVVTAGGQAEFGRAMGGYINLVTRSGTDKLHGDAYGYLQNQRLNAGDPLLGARLPLTQAQYGASLGGPLGRGQTYYFANFEQRVLNQDQLITIAPGNVAAVNAALRADGYPGQPIATGLYPNPVHSTNGFGRLDRTFSASDAFNLRYSLYHVDSRNSRGAGGLSAVSAAAGLRDTTQNLAVSNIKMLSGATVNETRGQVTYDDLAAPPNDPAGPAVAISGVATFGTLSYSPTARRNWMFEAVDNLSHQAGGHALKAGVDYLENSLALVFPHANRGSYAFASLAAFQAGVYNASGFTQAFVAPQVAFRNPNLGVYAQDAWSARPDLTLDFGVRYDLQWLPTIATDRGNVAPRLGFAWVPLASRRTVVRGGFGLFYGRVPLRALANALQSSDNTTAVTAATLVTASLSPGQSGAPAFPGILAAPPPGLRVDFTTMDPGMPESYSEQANLEVEQQIGRGTTVSAGVEHVRGRHLVLSVNLNPPTCAAAGGNNGCRAVAAYGNNKQYAPMGDSQYDALNLALHSQWGGARIQAAYTWAKALDDVGEFFFSAPTNNFAIRQDWSRSDDDLRSRLTLAAEVPLPAGLALSGTLIAASAPPLDVVAGGATVQGTALRPRLADGSIVGRNAGQGFGTLSLDARLSKSLRIGDRYTVSLLAQSFNALNHPNYLIPNATFGDGIYPTQPLPGFGRATAVAPARAVELGMRISF